MIEVKTEHYALTISSHDLTNAQLKAVATAAGVALAMQLRTNMLPFAVVNNWDSFFGNNITVSCGKPVTVRARK